MLGYPTMGSIFLLMVPTRYPVEVLDQRHVNCRRFFKSFDKILGFLTKSACSSGYCSTVCRGTVGTTCRIVG